MVHKEGNRLFAFELEMKRSMESCFISVTKTG